MITVLAGMFQIIRGAGCKYKAELKTIRKKEKKKKEPQPGSYDQF